MATVFFTNRRFPVGEIFDTRDFCEENRKALQSFPPEYQEVEDFLEEVRQEIQETGIDLPQRLCSILVIPWPDVVRVVPGEWKPGQKSLRFSPKETEEMPDPVGEEGFCYYVIPKRETKRFMVDDRWVQGLIESWPEIAGSSKAYEMARAYWDGQMQTFSERGMSFLFEGPVLIHSVCRSRIPA
jgi:hypothetical protein